MGISTVSKPHFLNVGKSETLSVVNGEVNRKELMPNLMVELEKKETRTDWMFEEEGGGPTTA
jgi:hypothetical protein